MVRIENITKSFGGLSVLKDINLDIESGGVIAILGPNASGKTTLIKCLLGMVIPNAGKIFFDNEMILGSWEYRDRINYLPQIADFPSNITIKELIGIVKDLRPKEANDKDLIHLFGLEGSMNKKLGTLSGGTKQKVNIVLTFMYDSELLILDEPTTGLDPVSLINLKELIIKEQKNRKTILLTTHIMSLVEEIADKIVYLLDGDIMFNGSPQELLKLAKESDLERAIAALIMKKNVENSEV